VIQHQAGAMLVTQNLWSPGTLALAQPAKINLWVYGQLNTVLTGGHYRMR
jgi:hypothetical protein